jgi:cbb3-type cytochrome oxidase subunit 3
MEGSLGAIFVFVVIICVAICVLIFALEAHRKNNE